jgi:hypothetical protein
MKTPFNRPAVIKREITEVTATLESVWITTVLARKTIWGMNFHHTAESGILSP